MTLTTLLLDVTAGPAGFNLVAACVWGAALVASFVAIAAALTNSNQQ